MKKYKALLTDVDGTLIPNKPDGLPSQRVLAAIIKAQKHIHIGIATSRPLFFAQHIFNALPLSGPCVVSGGAQIYDATTKKVLWTKIIESEDFSQVIEIITPFTSDIHINEGYRQIGYFSNYQPDKALGIFLPALSSEMASILVDKISIVSGVAVHKIASHTAGTFDINVSNALATKQHGVFEVAKILGIETDEIIGVGDGYNDFPLLMACGLKVAMGNAPDDLKAIADYIAPTVDDDGLAEVIEKFIL